MKRLPKLPCFFKEYSVQLPLAKEERIRVAQCFATSRSTIPVFKSPYQIIAIHHQLGEWMLLFGATAMDAQRWKTSQSAWFNSFFSDFSGFLIIFAALGVSWCFLLRSDPFDIFRWNALKGIQRNLIPRLQPDWWSHICKHHRNLKNLACPSPHILQTYFSPQTKCPNSAAI